MKSVIACLAPEVCDVARVEAALRELAEPDVCIVLLPLGGLAGGEGAQSHADLARALAALHEFARRSSIYFVGAHQLTGGEIFGFILDPQATSPLLQAAIGGGQGAAKVEVVETPAGLLACLPDVDILHPEYARLALFSGAEILLNPCRERADERSAARHFSRGARAWENFAYVASCSATVQEIWHPSGQLLVESRERAASARLDLRSLRSKRAEPWVNFPAQLRTALYAREYASAASRPAASEPELEAYDVLVMQSHQVFVAGVETRDATIETNLKQALGLARLFAMRPTTRLVVFPEFFLQGSGMSQPLEYWERCGIRIPGPETEALAAFAKSCNVYVSGAVLEYDPSWPRRFFNTAIIIAPSGEIILRYRKLQCADLNGLLNVTTPGSIHAEYVERYGADALVPVVDTPIGRLGALICFDSNWPELWRALAMKGAEVICNPTSEIHSNRRPHWYQAKRAHAAENLFYVASANAGSEQLFPGAPITSMNRGHSALIDYHGELAACADGPGVVPLLGRIELGALRRARAALADNPQVRFRPEAVAAGYANFPGFPLDCFLQTPMEKAGEGPALVETHIAKLQTLGILRGP